MGPNKFMDETKREIRNCPVAVIGGAGFIGSHVVDALIDRGCDVIVLDNLIAGKKDFINPKARFIWCDITHSESQLRKIFEQNKIQYVFNYAAEPYIPVSFERPMHTFSINATGALMVMNAAHDAGVRGVLQISSAEIYGEGRPEKIKEDTPTIPHSTYGAAKLAIDCLVQTRWKESKLPAIALRQFNVVGPRETHPYVIPEIIGQIVRGDGTVYLGNNSYRDFQYVEDAAQMAIELLEKGQFGEVYNMGSETGIKIYDLAVLIGDICNVKVVVKTDESRIRPWEIWHLQSDNTKIYSVIDYRPKNTLEQALKRTVAYFFENGMKWDF